LWRGLPDSELSHSRAKRAWIDGEQGRRAPGSADTPVGRVKCAADGLALGILQRHDVARWSGDFADLRLIEKPIDFHRWAGGADARWCEMFPQLGGVARTGVPKKPTQRTRRDRGHVRVELALQPGEQVVDELRNVLRPLAQRRHPDGKHAQAIEEILPERS